MRTAPIAILALLAALAPATRAGDFYVGGAAGWSSVRNTLTSSVFDSDDVGYKGFAGYAVIENVAVELSYTELGNFGGEQGATRLDASANAIAAWGLARFPLGEIFSVWVKLGLARTQVDVQLQQGGETSSADRDDTDLSWGVGVGARIAKRLAFRVEWEEYMGDAADKIQFASLGLQIDF